MEGSPTQSIYTTGYTGKKPQDLKGLVLRLDAVLLDIRFSPNSRVPHWQGGALRELLGDRYRHIPELGNRNYQTPGVIRIADAERGLRRVLDCDRPVILLCACDNPETCHRRVVARMLEADGHTVTELRAWAEKPETLPLFT